MVKPFLKWLGSKTQILDKIHVAPCKDYYEPFLGGGSTLFAALESGKIGGTVYASDSNPYLINLYKHIQSDPEDFIHQIAAVVERYRDSEDQTAFYYAARLEFNENHDTALFLFLNKTCFRGVYRTGPRGFNVPFGNNKNPEIFNPEHIREVSNLIRSVVFECNSYENVLVNIGPGDFCYLDPPYYPINETSFVQYTAKGFSRDDHEKLFEMVKELPCRWLMSNASVPTVVETFDGYPTETISCRRAIHSTKPGTRALEVLISNR
jgi:DNA adenine methylase